MKFFLILIVFISFVFANDNIVHKHHYHIYKHKKYSLSEHGCHMVLIKQKQGDKTVLIPEIAPNILFVPVIPQKPVYTEFGENK